jgi:hypothetical protein
MRSFAGAQDDMAFDEEREEVAIRHTSKYFRDIHMRIATSSPMNNLITLSF